MSTVVNSRYSPTRLPEAARTLRKKAASPVVTKRFSPYKPSFSLLQDGQPKIPSSDQFEETMTLFPNCTSVKTMLSFLVETLILKSKNVTVDGIRRFDRGITVVTRVHNYCNRKARP